MRLFRMIIFATAVSIAMTALISVMEFHGWFRDPQHRTQQSASFLREIVSELTQGFKGNLIALLIENGHVVSEIAVGPEGAVPSQESVFQVASLSKWVTAAGVLTLVDDGVVSLDDPVSDHLTRWNFPPSVFDTGKVTVRHLLSHTGGLTDELGYLGFTDTGAVQSLEASLDEALDAMPGASGQIKVSKGPGATWQYSGGGYTVLQLMIEEVTHQRFSDAMTDLVFAPLAMNSSSFDHAKSAFQLAPVFDRSGALVEPRYYTAVAAASLYTSAHDLALFLASLHTEQTGENRLSDTIIAEMANVHGRLFGTPFWGLGTTLYVWDEARAVVVGHDGLNHPAIYTTARLHKPSGDGIIVLTSGAIDIASRIGDHWAMWRTGRMSITALPARITRICVVFVAITAFFLIARLVFEKCRR